MDLKKFKLALINQIMRTDDLELLQTIQQILSLNNHTFEQNVPEQMKPFEHPMRPQKTNLNQDAQELQDSIDEIFNP